MDNLKYNYLDDYLEQLRSKGKYSFTIKGIKNELNVSDEAIKKSIQRLKKKSRVELIRKGFYVIITPEYRNRGVVPPILFIDSLMKYLDRRYYVGLLNAAANYGAAHQQPQEFFVITEKPSMRSIKNKKLSLNFCFKKDWSDKDINKINTETGYVNISTPELTSLDLIYYQDRVGGLNRVTTILAELVDEIKPDKLMMTLERFNYIASVQRLGYLLENKIKNFNLANVVREFLSDKKYYPVLLKQQKGKVNGKKASNFWKVVPNIEIESDI